MNYPKRMWKGILLSRVLFKLTEDRLGFLCPGCSDIHYVAIAPSLSPWEWDGDVDKPTFKPSVLVTHGHYMEGHQGPSCWCTFNVEHPEDPVTFTCKRCHSYIIKGEIHFLSDCSHPLAGATLPLGDIESHLQKFEDFDDKEYD